jgi:mannose-6-phosphate isomerase-like protein (cupin superfamily)
VGEIKEQVGQDEVNGGQKQLRDKEEMEKSENDSDAVSETHKLPNPGNDLLNMIWKTMQEDKVEQDRSRLETEEQ